MTPQMLNAHLRAQQGQHEEHAVREGRVLRQCPRWVLARRAAALRPARCAKTQYMCVCAPRLATASPPTSTHPPGGREGDLKLGRHLGIGGAQPADVGRHVHQYEGGIAGGPGGPQCSRGHLTAQARARGTRGGCWEVARGGGCQLQAWCGPGGAREQVKRAWPAPQARDQPSCGLGCNSESARSWGCSGDFQPAPRPPARGLHQPRSAPDVHGGFHRDRKSVQTVEPSGTDVFGRVSAVRGAVSLQT